MTMTSTLLLILSIAECLNVEKDAFNYRAHRALGKPIGGKSQNSYAAQMPTEIRTFSDRFSVLTK